MVAAQVYPSRGHTGFSTEFPGGLLALETGPRWSWHRRLISPLFSDSSLKSYSAEIAEQARVLLRKWDAACERGRTTNVHHDVSAQ